MLDAYVQIIFIVVLFVISYLAAQMLGSKDNLGFTLVLFSFLSIALYIFDVVNIGIVFVGILAFVLAYMMEKRKGEVKPI